MYKALSFGVAAFLVLVIACAMPGTSFAGTITVSTSCTAPNTGKCPGGTIGGAIANPPDFVESGFGFTAPPSAMLQPGDIILCEVALTAGVCPGTANNNFTNVSDLLRVTCNIATGQNCQVAFFSDREPNEVNPDRADGGFPAALDQMNFFDIPEPVDENGFEKIIYNVTIGNNTLTYTIFSDNVPEPRTSTLLLLAFVLVAACRCERLLRPTDHD